MSSSIAPAPTEPNYESPKKMRRVIIAKALVLTALGLYLAMGIGGALRSGADPAPRWQQRITSTCAERTRCERDRSGWKPRGLPSSNVILAQR